MSKLSNGVKSHWRRVRFALRGTTSLRGQFLTSLSGPAGERRTSASFNTTRRRSNSKSPSTHMSFLGSFSIARKPAARKKRKVAPKRKAVKNKIPSKNSSKSPGSVDNNSVSEFKNNMSFDISAQIEEVFKANADEAEHHKDDDVFVRPKDGETPRRSVVKRHAGKRVSFFLNGDNVEDGPGSPSPPKQAKLDCDKVESETKCKDLLRGEHSAGKGNSDLFDDSGDFFGDSFLTTQALEALDDIEKKSNSSNVNVTKPADNKSCPKTPKFEACTEELEFSEIKNETNKISDEVAVIDSVKDFTITDSFLEDAFNSHMTAEYDAKSDDKCKVEEKSNPVPNSPRSILTRSKSTVESPMRSQRLMQRKKLVKKEASRNALNKISPGSNLIFSDSDDGESSPKVSEAKPKVLVLEDTNQDIMNVVDVCANRVLFDHFVKELKAQKSLSIGLACEHYANKNNNVNANSNAIGQRVTRQRSTKKKQVKDDIVSDGTIPEFETKVLGIVFSWSKLDAYYMSLQDSRDPKGSLQAEKHGRIC